MFGVLGLGLGLGLRLIPLWTLSQYYTQHYPMLTLQDCNNSLERMCNMEPSLSLCHCFSDGPVRQWAAPALPERPVAPHVHGYVPAEHAQAGALPRTQIRGDTRRTGNGDGEAGGRMQHGNDGGGVVKGMYHSLHGDHGRCRSHGWWVRISARDRRFTERSRCVRRVDKRIRVSGRVETNVWIPREHPGDRVVSTGERSRVRQIAQFLADGRRGTVRADDDDNEEAARAAQRHRRRRSKRVRTGAWFIIFLALQIP